MAQRWRSCSAAPDKGLDDYKVPESYKFAVAAVQQERADKTLQDHLRSGAFAMGNPDTVIKVLKKYQEAGKGWPCYRGR